MPKGLKQGTVSVKKNAKGNKFQPIGSKKKLKQVAGQALAGFMKKSRGR